MWMQVKWDPRRTGRDPHSHPCPNLSLFPHIWGQKSLKVSFRGPHRTSHPRLPERDGNWLGSFLPLQALGPPCPSCPTGPSPPSAAFVAQGSEERVPTGQEPASPTLTSRSWRHICPPAIPQRACRPRRARPGSLAAFLTCPLPRAQPPSPPSGQIRDTFRCGWIQQPCSCHVLPSSADGGPASSPPLTPQAAGLKIPSNFPPEFLMNLPIFLHAPFPPCLAPVIAHLDQHSHPCSGHLPPAFTPHSPSSPQSQRAPGSP